MEGFESFESDALKGGESDRNMGGKRNQPDKYESPGMRELKQQARRLRDKSGVKTEKPATGKKVGGNIEETIKRILKERPLSMRELEQEARKLRKPTEGRIQKPITAEQKPDLETQKEEQRKRDEVSLMEVRKEVEEL